MLVDQVPQEQSRQLADHHQVAASSSRSLSLSSSPKFSPPFIEACNKENILETKEKLESVRRSKDEEIRKV